MPALGFVLFSMYLGVATAKAMHPWYAGPIGFSRPLLALGLWLAGIVTPVCTVFWRFYPAYTLSYRVDADFFESRYGMLAMVSLLAVSANFFSAYWGFTWTRKALLQTPKNASVRVLAWAMRTVAVLLIVLNGNKSLWLLGAQTSAATPTFVLSSLCGWLGLGFVIASLGFARYLQSGSPRLVAKH